MRLNLGAVLHVTHAYVGAMVDSGWGRIVTIVSDAGRRGERFQAIYGAAKAGAMGFIRGLAAEVGAHGVTANCVALGTMKTGVTEDALDAEPRARGEARPALHRAAARPARRSGPARRPALQRRRGPGSPARCTRSTAATSASPLDPARRIAGGRPMIPRGARVGGVSVGGMASRRQSKSRARTEAAPRARVQTRAAWRDELSEQLADHRIDALAIGARRLRPPEPARDLLRSRRSGRAGHRHRRRPGSSAGARCSCRSRSLGGGRRRPLVQRRGDDDDEEVAEAAGLRFGLGLVARLRRGRRRVAPRPRQAADRIARTAEARGRRHRRRDRRAVARRPRHAGAVDRARRDRRARAPARRRHRACARSRSAIATGGRFVGRQARADADAAVRARGRRRPTPPMPPTPTRHARCCSTSSTTRRSSISSRPRTKLDEDE